MKLNGEMVYLWRAVDHEGEILESYVTKTRDKAAALTSMKKALKRHGSPQAITTDGLRSYKASMEDLGCEEKQKVDAGPTTGARTHTWHSDDESAARAGSGVQKFASVHANVHNHFALERHLTDRQTYKERRSAALAALQIIAS